MQCSEHPLQFELRNLQNFDRMMKHIKMGCKNIFNKKKTHVIYHSNLLLEFVIFAFSVINSHRGVEWVGTFLKKFQKRRRRYRLKS